ncbi:MAG: ACP S-malonyltransferase [Spirochaetia bacterium]|jgi:[acyl-carrier-protein] S-malonyltransferase|nr:ACP S-malonyltransferase [Spirochaetia bacterium]
MKTVFLFPGQGAQYPGMGKDLWDHSARVKELFRLASDLTHTDMEKLLFEGSAEDLRATDKAQAAITLANLAAAAVLRGRGILPGAAAGFSLGEYAALAVCGVIGEEAVFSLVKFRGGVMESASRALDAPEGPPGMSAVVGLDLPDVTGALEAAGVRDVYAANYNSPAQTVVSGGAAALSKAEAVLKAAGARRCIRLKVSGPFHSPLLASARAEFEAELAKHAFADPALPLYSNVTGKRVSSGEEARRLAGEQITSPVLWVNIERSLKAEGFQRALEAGPGTVLGGLWKAVCPETPCLPAGTWEAIQALEGAAET